MQYAVLTACYWAFTLSDGALRMLVLLHLHAAGRGPLELLAALLPYELAGVVANLAAGWLGAQAGLRALLLVGLSLQVAVCVVLGFAAAAPSVLLVMVVQLASGVAKDLTKTGAKSFTARFADAADHGRLFRLVALLTGSKNALKGLGYFAGGLLLATVGFAAAMWLLAGLLAVAVAAAWRLLPREAGRTDGRAGMRALFAQQAWLNWLAAARLFLFGSRDAWFAVGLPLFLVADAGWSQSGTGAFLAAWVIGYGVVQALAPRVLRVSGPVGGGRAVFLVTAGLLLPLGAGWWLLGAGWAPGPVLVGTLTVYGVLFALDSSLHSWLVVARGGEAVALQVGFYYAANAAGRVCGLAASALLFGAGGLDGMRGCLMGSIVAVLLAAVCSVPLGARHGGRAAG